MAARSRCPRAFIRPRRLRQIRPLCREGHGRRSRVFTHSLYGKLQCTSALAMYCQGSLWRERDSAMRPCPLPGCIFRLQFRAVIGEACSRCTASVIARWLSLPCCACWLAVAAAQSSSIVITCWMASSCYIRAAATRTSIILCTRSCAHLPRQRGGNSYVLCALAFFSFDMNDRGSAIIKACSWKGLRRRSLQRTAAAQSSMVDIIRRGRGHAIGFAFAIAFAAARSSGMS